MKHRVFQLGQKAQVLISELRSKDSYDFNACSRRAAIGNAICKASALQFGSAEEQEAFKDIIATLSDYNELITALSE